MTKLLYVFMSKAKSAFDSRNILGIIMDKSLSITQIFSFRNCDKYGVIPGEELTKENCRIEHFALCFGE